MVIKKQPCGRFSRLVREQMFGLDLPALVQATAETESIHIWRPPKAKQQKKDQTIKSEETYDADEAVKAVKKGGSLYFTSSPDFRNTYDKQLSF